MSQSAEFVLEYFSRFSQALNNMSAFEGGKVTDVTAAITKAADVVEAAGKDNRKIYIVGNGGSAGISSHMAVDFWKNGGIRATAFNDSSLLTCVANDYSFDEVFSKPVEMFCDKGDILMCISSSGLSKNILNAAEAGKKAGCYVMTFSGFSETNKLKNLGDLNFFVPAHSYGYVEILHNFIIHAILDCKLYVHDRKDVFNRNLPIDSNLAGK